MKIAVVGANGQVGREVSLFLSVMGVDVIPISRTELGGIFLERCGLNCRYGSVSDEKEVKILLDGCDLVVDFAHPNDLPSKIRKAVKSNIDNISKHAPKGASYVYISTISAFGMRHDDSKMKNYFFSRTTYAADKRYLERHALAQQNKRDIYVLRLSQVHGELQKVSQEFINETACGKVNLPFSADTGSYTVFCYSLAEAMINIAQGKEQPGRYTFVSTPKWSWGEVYSYWAYRSGIEFELTSHENVNQQNIGLRSILNTSKLLLLPILRLGIKHRQLILNYILGKFPLVQERMMAEFLRRKAVTEMADGKKEKMGRKFQIGKIPGKRLVSLSDSRLTMEKSTLAVRAIIQAADPFSVSVPTFNDELEVRDET
jgi:dTDP-4-dehydrorhamnose reductase